MDSSVVDEFKSSLKDLNINSKPLINMLTMLAEDNKQLSPQFVQAVVDHISSVSSECKLPALYLLDSIMKNIREEYIELFEEHIVEIFCATFLKVDENTRGLMFKLRQTWSPCFSNKTLLNLDRCVQKIDSAWPITAKNLAKKILFNPKFLGPGAIKHAKDVPGNASKKDKNAQEDLLKQLLAKQEQLRLHEMKKLHKSIKEKVSAVIPSIPAKPIKVFKLSAQDPRLPSLRKRAHTKVFDMKVQSPEIGSYVPNQLSEKLETVSCTIPKDSLLMPKNTEIKTSTNSSCLKLKAQPKPKSHKTVAKKNSTSSFSADAPAEKEGNESGIASNKLKTLDAKINFEGLDIAPKTVTRKKFNPSFKIPKTSSVASLEVNNINTGKYYKNAWFHEKDIHKWGSFETKSKLERETSLETSSCDSKKEKADVFMKSTLSIHSVLEFSKETEASLESSKVCSKSAIVDLIVSPKKVKDTESLEDMGESVEPKTKKLKVEHSKPDISEPDSCLCENDNQAMKMKENISSSKMHKIEPMLKILPSKQEIKRTNKPWSEPLSNISTFANTEHQYNITRYSRGRFRSRFDPRNFRFQRQSIVAHRTSSVEFDPSAALEKVQDSFNKGKLSEAEYSEICFDLKKMLSSNQQPIKPQSKIQDVVHRPDENLCRGNKQKQNLLFQGHSMPPSTKVFILDGKESIIYFAEDKALIIMQNQEPREITFKNESRQVFIDGLVTPLVLEFDGKLHEFDMNGARHSIRLGLPGREIYINNVPYEALFGGPPFKVLLQDNYICTLRLSGPPPQILIGQKPEFELFAKYHGNTSQHVPIAIPSIKNEELKFKSDTSDPVSTIKDVDMRVNPQSALSANFSLNSPFYSESTKDIDWRCMPPILFPEMNHMDEDITQAPSHGNNTSNAQEINKDIKHFGETYNQEAPAEFSGVPCQPYEKRDITPIHSQTWQSNKDEDLRNIRPISECKPPEPVETYHMQSDSTGTSTVLGENSSNFSGIQPYQPPQQRQFTVLPPPPAFGQLPLDFNVSCSSNNNIQATVLQVSARPLLGLPPIPNFSVSSAHNFLPLPHFNTMDNLGCSSVPLDLKHKDEPLELMQTELPSTEAKVDVESLLEKLIAAGIISKPEEVQNSPILAADDSKESSKTQLSTIKLFDAAHLREENKDNIALLHEGIQCTLCGARFKETQKEEYKLHLDWHFHQNQKDSSKIRHPPQPFVKLPEWLCSSVKADVDTDKGPNFFEPEAQIEQELPAVVGVPATSNDDETLEAEDVTGGVPRSSISDSDAISSKTNKAIELMKEIVPLVTVLLEETSKNNNELNSSIDVIIETDNNTPDFANQSCKVTVKKMEEELEEEEEIILEGKPGEEEIIGVISDVDADKEESFPPSQAKMVTLQSGGITLKVKAERLQHAPAPEKVSKPDEEMLDEEDIEFRPPTPDPNFQVMPAISKGHELSGLCCIM